MLLCHRTFPASGRWKRAAVEGGLHGAVIRHDCLHRQTRILFDVLRQSIVYLVVTRNWLLLPGRRIVINVVAPAVAQENTVLRLKLANKLATLHSAISFVL